MSIAICPVFFSATILFIVDSMLCRLRRKTEVDRRPTPNSIEPVILEPFWAMDFESDPGNC